MIDAFIKFHKGLLQQPLHVKVWLLFLIAANMVVPLFYLQQIEAQVTLGVFLASFMLMILLTAYGGYSRLLGAGHFLWFPLLYFLWARLAYHPTDASFGLWMRSVMLLNGTSLVIDVIDVVRYAAGDRRETVPNL